MKTKKPNYLSLYKSLTSAERLMFRDVMKWLSVNKNTWRKWLSRNNVPLKYEKIINLILCKNEKKH